MLTHYFKTAWRSISRNKAISAINLFGLSIALAVFIFIALWVHNELNFDNFHNGSKDIYLVQQKWSESQTPGSITVFPLADALKKDPHVQYVSRAGWWTGTINVNKTLFEIKSGQAVDSDWFKIFHYDVVSGDINSFNRNPFSLIFTESKAKQIFGNKNPIGQIVKLDTTLYQIRAIVKDNPTNSSLQFEMLSPMAARLSDPQKVNGNTWWNASYRTFVKLYPKSNINSFLKNASAIVQKESQQKDISVALQPLRELHFDTKSGDPLFRRSSHTTVFIFSVLAILLLITASINYVNLTIAKAGARTKEISVRKIIGGSRLQLFIQFLTESFLLCILSLVIAFIVVQIALPAFDRFTETKFQLSFSSPLLWYVLLGTLLFSTLLNGVFPALTMAFFKPLNFLRGYSILKFKNVVVRKVLVVFQFAVGMFFVIGTMVIFMQMHLAQTSTAQYNRAQVVSFELPSITYNKMRTYQQVNLFCQSIKNNLLKNGGIQNVAIASNSFDEIGNARGAQDYFWNGIDTSLHTTVFHMSVEAEAKDIFGLQMQEGRWFNSDNKFDSKNFILNETAIKQLGIQEPVVGQLFINKGSDTGRIIGVVKDFCFNSIRDQIGALVIRNDNSDEGGTTFFVKIAPGKIPETMKAMEATWKKFIPDAPFDYQFMNQAFDNLYKNDLKISNLILLFSSISIIISALGLFGLAAFVAEQRRKEIGIRKVFGASVKSIVLLLSSDFMKLVLIAIVVATPVAWWAAKKWLNNFAYKIHLSWWIFFAAGIVVFVVAFFTVSSHTIRAARANPVRSLKTE